MPHVLPVADSDASADDEAAMLGEYLSVQHRIVIPIFNHAHGGRNCQCDRATSFVVLLFPHIARDDSEAKMDFRQASYA